MIEMECPHCGGRGSAPREKANVRLLCKKCHGVFHMSETGRTMVGDPPGAHAPSRAAEPGAKPGIKAEEDDSPLLRALLNLGIKRTRVVLTRALLFVIVLFVLSFYLWQAMPEELLAVKAERAAAALTADDTSFLRGIATPSTVGEFDQWYGLVRPLVDDLKKKSNGRDLQVSVLVRSEDAEATLGEVVLVLVPTAASSAIETKAVASKPGKPVDLASSGVELTTFWGPRGFGFGTWGLDFQKSLDHVRMNRPR